MSRVFKHIVRRHDSASVNGSIRRPTIYETGPAQWDFELHRLG